MLFCLLIFPIFDTLKMKRFFYHFYTIYGFKCYLFFCVRQGCQQSLEISAKRSAGVAPDVNLMEWLSNPEETSPKVQNRGINDPTKRTYVLQKVISLKSLEISNWTLLSKILLRLKYMVTHKYNIPFPCVFLVHRPHGKCSSTAQLQLTEPEGYVSTSLPSMGPDAGPSPGT